MGLLSRGDDDDDDNNDDDDYSDDPDHNFLVLPPHLVFDFPGGVPHIEGLIS